jgi:hypothetical protein
MNANDSGLPVTGIDAVGDGLFHDPKYAACTVHIIVSGEEWLVSSGVSVRVCACACVRVYRVAVRMYRVKARITAVKVSGSIGFLFLSTSSGRDAVASAAASGELCAFAASWCR